jgi:UDP-3-O-[3-hydroxymyristoyl] glucosamine N-acyltransferase
LQIFKEAVLRKFKLINLVNPTTALPDSASLGINIYIGSSCTVKEGCSIGNGTFISSASALGVNASIGEFSFIGQDVRVDSHVNIGRHVYIGDGAHIRAKSIGSFCSLENSRIYSNNFNPMTHDLKGHRALITPINFQ